jgi:hypothetical protein
MRVSAVDSSTIDALSITVEQLCCDYSHADARELMNTSKEWLRKITAARAYHHRLRTSSPPIPRRRQFSPTTPTRRSWSPATSTRSQTKCPRLPFQLLPLLDTVPPIRGRRGQPRRHAAGAVRRSWLRLRQSTGGRCARGSPASPAENGVPTTRDEIMRGPARSELPAIKITRSGWSISRTSVPVRRIRWRLGVSPGSARPVEPAEGARR